MFGVVSRLRRAKRKASLSILKRKEIELDLQGRALFVTRRSQETTPNEGDILVLCPSLEKRKKMKNRLFILGLIAILTACNLKDKSTEKVMNQKQNRTDSTLETDNNTQTNIKIEKSIKLANGFIVKVGKSEDFETFKTYSFFELTHSDKVIYTDTMREFEFGDKLYPIVLHTGADSYELMFEVNDRPNKNYLLRLFVKNQRLVRNDTLPTFITKAYDLDGDGIKEYVGFWCYNETWGENNDLTAYNPILFYKIRPTGLTLDSTLTINRNKKIYGEFSGFYYDESHTVSIGKADKFGVEINRIEKLK